MSLLCLLKDVCDCINEFIRFFLVFRNVLVHLPPVIR